MEKRALEVPVFFPSASRVKIPFVGDDTRHVKVAKPDLNPVSNPLKKHQTYVGKQLIKAISNDFAFTKEVVQERCAHALPYDGDEIQAIYDCSDIISTRPVTTSSGGRFDTRGFNRKIPGHIKKLRSPRAAKMKQKSMTVTERYGELSPARTISSKSEKEKPLPTVKQIFITEPDLSPRIVPISAGDTRSPKTRKQKGSGKWDEYVIGKLSKDTARWIVFDNMDPGSQKDRLNELIKQKFGGKVSNINLVREEVIGL